MNDELDNIRHPSRLRIFWASVYAFLVIIVISGAGLAATQIRTHIIPNGSVQLTLPYSKYVVGETISFSIKNNYNSSIYLINNCPSEPLAVYRQENGKWVRIHYQASEESCPDEQRQVSVFPGGVINGNFAAWQNLFNQPGKYRVVAFVEYYNSLPYQDFEIVTGGSVTSSSSSSQQTNTTVQSGPTTVLDDE